MRLPEYFVVGVTAYVVLLASYLLHSELQHYRQRWSSPVAVESYYSQSARGRTGSEPVRFTIDQSYYVRPSKPESSNYGFVPSVPSGPYYYPQSARGWTGSKPVLFTIDQSDYVRRKKGSIEN